MPLPAFSNIGLGGNNARLLWSCYFNNGIAFDTPDNSPTIYYYVGAVTGVDSNSHGAATINNAFGVTGYTGKLEMTYIMDDILVDHPLSDRFTQTIRPSTFPGGIGNEIEINQLARVTYAPWTVSKPQMELQLLLNNATQCRNEYYCSKFVEIPSNLGDWFNNAGGVSWLVIEDVKCGTSTDNDMRLTIDVIRRAGDTGYRFRSQLDDCGTNILTGVSGGAPGGLDIIYPGGVPTVDAIDYNDTDEGSVTPGSRYHLEYWIKRSADSSDLTTGRFVAVATDMSTGVRQTLINKTGGQFWGYHSYHFQRFFPALVYTGGFPASGNVTMKFSNIEYWTKPRGVFP